MLWGDRQVSQWESSINQTIRNLGVTHVLGFNEPEYPSQANMTPSHGASLWKAQVEPLRLQGVRLGSPAPTSDPAGKQWLLDWLTACDGGCTVDFIALHWYDINSTAFIAYLEDFHETFQRPLWITEWACQVSHLYVMSRASADRCMCLCQNFNVADEQCSLQNIIDFMNATQAFMDATNWVERYAWFGAMERLQGVNAVRPRCVFLPVMADFHLRMMPSWTLRAESTHSGNNTLGRVCLTLALIPRPGLWTEEAVVQPTRP